MKLGDFKKELSKFDDENDVIFFSNGYKEVAVTTFDNTIIIKGVGKICGCPKCAIENMGQGSDAGEVCSCCDSDE